MAVREGLIRCAHPAGRRWRSQTQAFCRSLSRVLTLPVGALCIQRSLNASSGFFVEYGGEGGIDSLRSPCGPPLAVQNAGVLSNPVEGSHPPGQCAMHTKSLNASSGFFVEYGGEGGIDSLRSPCGPPLAVQNAGVLSNPVEGSHPPGWCAMHTKSLNASSGFFVEYGGEGGIRTLDTLSRIHTFGRAPSATRTPHHIFCCEIIAATGRYYRE